MTNTEILNAVAQAVNDGTFKRRTKAVMLGILTDAQNYIIDKTECLRKIDITLTLAEGDGEINLPSGFVKFPTDDASIKRGLIGLGTGGAVVLTSTTTAFLNHEQPGWRNLDNGVPEFFYLIKSGTPKIGFFPKASSDFIDENGSGIYVDMVYRPTGTLAEDSNLPFDNSTVLSGVFQVLQKLRAIWQIKLEDMQFADADRVRLAVNEMFPEAQDFINSLLVVPGNHGFEENFQ